MSTAAPTFATTRAHQKTRTVPRDPAAPDPRPVTDYGVDVSEVGGNTVVNVKLAQPCVVRTPNWTVVNSKDGKHVHADSMTIISNDEFSFTFSGTLDTTFNFIEVPYQDMQVQNFQGGFVAPGARWFRDPNP